MADVVRGLREPQRTLSSMSLRPGQIGVPGAVTSADGPAARPDPVDADGRIVADVACIRCGYALTGLAASGTCPECGVEVIRSLAEDRIADADPAWLATVYRGLWLLAFGPITAIVAGATWIGAAIVEDATSTMASWDPWRDALAYGRQGLVAVMMLGLVGGALVARWGLVASVVLLVAWRMASGHVPWPWADVGQDLVGAMAVASGGFALAALHERFRRLAVRVPAFALAERCTKAGGWYRKTTKFLAILFLIAAVHDTIAAYPHAPGLATVADLIQLSVALGGCVAMVLVVIGFFRTIAILDLSLALRSRIRSAVAGARSAAAPPAAPAPSSAPAPASGDPTP